MKLYIIGRQRSRHRQISYQTGMNAYHHRSIWEKSFLKEIRWNGTIKLKPESKWDIFNAKSSWKCSTNQKKNQRIQPFYYRIYNIYFHYRSWIIHVHSALLFSCIFQWRPSTRNTLYSIRSALVFKNMNPNRWTTWNDYFLAN